MHGINVNFNDMDLEDVGSELSTGAAMDIKQFNYDKLDWDEDEDMLEQDLHKGRNLAFIPKVNRRFDNDQARRDWWREDLFDGMYNLARNSGPQQESLRIGKKKINEIKARVMLEAKLNDP